MENFILEEQIEKVINPRTKECLTEVVSSYRNGNYRACIVVLYTTVIFDLIQKLITLKNVYNDDKAATIYSKIKNNQKNNRNNSQWETELIRKMCEEMNIMSNVEKEELEHLKKERNYAAHPVISGDDELALKTIRKETAADLIRKAFEIVFLRDSILAKNINEDIVGDLNEYYSRVKEEGLKEYLHYKYFSRMNRARKDALYKYLWKKVFILNDMDSDKNRYSNLKGLLYLHLEDKNRFKQLIKENEDVLLNKIECETFSSWSTQKGYNSNDTRAIVEFKYMSRIISFIRFIELNPEIHEALNDYSKNIIESSIQKMFSDIIKNDIRYMKEQYYLESTAVFLNDDIEEHLKEIRSKRSPSNDMVLDRNDLELILNQVEYRGYMNVFKLFLIDYCSETTSFDDMQKHFDDIEICENYFQELDYYYILKVMNSNSQIYNNNYIYLKKDNKGGWIEKLENSYEKKFNRKLANSAEEKKLYFNLYSSLEHKKRSNNSFSSKKPCETWDKDKMLSVIDERASLYDKSELTNILSDLKVKLPCGNFTSLLEYMETSQEKYQNINKIIESGL